MAGQPGEPAPDEAGLAFNAAERSYSGGDYADAIASYDRARSLFLERRQEVEAAWCGWGAAKASVSLNQFGPLLETIHRLVQARVLFLANDMQYDAAGCDLLLGGLLTNLGEPQWGIARLESARATYSARHQEADVARVDAYIEIARRNLLDRSIPSDSLDRRKAVLYMVVAGPMLADFNPEDALSRLRQARAIFFGLGREVDVAMCDGAIGAALARMEAPGEALLHYGRAQAAFLAAGVQGPLAECRFEMAEALGHVGQEAEGIKLAEAARTAFESLGKVVETARCDLAIGTMLLTATLETGGMLFDMRVLPGAADPYQRAPTLLESMNRSRRARAAFDGRGMAVEVAL